MSDIFLTADQNRIACQIDTFLVHLLEEDRVNHATTPESGVGFHPSSAGIVAIMTVQHRIAEQLHTFVVRHLCPSYCSTSTLYYTARRMFQEYVTQATKIGYKPEPPGGVLLQRCDACGCYVLGGTCDCGSGCCKECCTECCEFEDGDERPKFDPANEAMGFDPYEEWDPAIDSEFNDTEFQED